MSHEENMRLQRDLTLSKEVQHRNVTGILKNVCVIVHDGQFLCKINA